MRKWLEKQIDYWKNFPEEARNPDDYLDAQEIIREAHARAIEARLPEVAEACRPGPVLVRLVEILNAIPEPETNGAMSVSQVAKQLGVSKETIYERCRDGRFPCTRIGKRIVITPEQLASYQSALPASGGAMRHLS